MQGFLRMLVLAVLPGVLAMTDVSVSQAVPVAGKECPSPTHFIEVTSGVGTKFDKLEIRVPRATCVKITLNNKELGEHDFTIDGSPDMEVVYIPVNRGDVKSFNVLTPDMDITYEFFCTISGHRTQGMKGRFIVGEGLRKGKKDSSLPVLLISLAALLGVGAIFWIRKRKKQ